MKTSHPIRIATLLGLVSSTLTAAPLGTAFTYQGKLTEGGQPAQGNFDFRFAIYDAAGGGSPLASPITNSAVSVTNGLFATTLDFGGVFTGEARWLEIAVRTNGGGAFSLLSPRQPLTPAPYALYATNAGAASYAATAGAAASAATAPWTGLTGVPVGFADGLDNDTLYSAGPGLQLLGTVFSAQFAGNGTANTVARSDHDHAGVYAPTNHTHDAADLTAGTLADARLTANVALRYADQTFTGSNTFSGVLLATNAANQLAGTFTGDGAALTNLNAAHLTGTVAEARIDAPVARTNQVWPLVLAQDGAGSGLDADLLDGQHASAFAAAAHSHDAADISSGTLSDARLSANVALLNSSPTFTGTITAVGDLKAARLNVGANHTLEAPYATIAGGQANRIQFTSLPPTNAVISGGESNRIESRWATISGGALNTIESGAEHSSIGGGAVNSIQWEADQAVIAGGGYNTIGINNNAATIGGGSGNTIQQDALYATVSGGLSNRVGASAAYAVVPGGLQNTAAGAYSFAAGRRAKGNHPGTFVWADSTDADFASTAANQLLIRAGGGVGINKNNPATALDVNGTVTATTFSGSGSGLTTLNGAALTAGTVGTAALANNAVTTAKLADATVTSAKLANGAVVAAALADNAVTSTKILDGTIATTDLADGSVTPAKLASDPASLGKVSGGTMAVSGANVGIGTATPGFKLEVNGDIRASRLNIGSAHVLSGAGATIAGGQENTNAAQWATLGGGHANYIESGAIGASLAGGEGNHIQSNADSSTIGGGYGNHIGSYADYATIAGGIQNTNFGALYAVLGGGAQNKIQSGADWTVISGGSGNTAGSSAVASAIGGGQLNTIGNNVDYGTIPGGYANTVGGDYSFAAGRQAKANHTGCFVWADSTGADFASSAANQFLIRASGGVGIGTNSPAQRLHVAGRIRMDTWSADGNTAVYKNANGDIGVQASDARLKQNVAPITNALAAVRHMTGVTFNWRGDAPDARKSVGLLAQEVQAVMPELTFECQGEDGQTYLGVHYEKVTALLVNALQETAAQVAAQQAEIGALKEKLARLEQLLTDKDGGAQ